MPLHPDGALCTIATVMRTFLSTLRPGWSEDVRRPSGNDENPTLVARKSTWDRWRHLHSGDGNTHNGVIPMALLELWRWVSHICANSIACVRSGAGNAHSRHQKIVDNSHAHLPVMLSTLFSGKPPFVASVEKWPNPTSWLTLLLASTRPAYALALVV